MQPQDNDFPLDQIQGGGQSNPDPAGQTDATSGGATFQPQASPASSAAPSWQNDAASDAAALYAGSPAPTGSNSVNVSGVAPQSSATDTVSQDFNQASQLGAPTAMPLADTSASSSQAISPVAPSSQDQTGSETPSSAMPNQPAEPISSPVPTNETMPQASPENNPVNDMGGTPPPDVPGAAPVAAEVTESTSAARLAPEPGALPGSEQLGAAAAGMDNPMQGIDPVLAQAHSMEGAAPPPKGNKKIIFVIIGAIVGIIIIVVAIILITSSGRKNQSATGPTTQNISNTNTTTNNTTTTPSSGPATPPAGYVTIEKECYTFALYNPNTVPSDKACTFEDATFGELAKSTISATTFTDSYKNISEYLDPIKSTITIISETDIKLDTFDSKQIVYKSSDGKTRSKVVGLITGKNYQQDGKPVTGFDITTTYQNDFDRGVTANVIDTWRWK